MDNNQNIVVIYHLRFYYIDGLALGPGYFGFTDPLTNTWRPKKFRAVGTTINDGTVWSSLNFSLMLDVTMTGWIQKLMHLMVMDLIKHLQQTIQTGPHKTLIP